MPENDNFYKSIVENLNSAFAYHKIVLDDNNKPIDYQILEVNKAFEEMAGLSAKDLIGKTNSDLKPPHKKEFKKLLEIFAEAALKGHTKEFEHYSDNLDKWFHITVIGPKPGYFITITYEISLLKKIEERVLFTENRYKRIIETANEGIWELNENLSTKYINNKMAEMLGYTKEEMIGAKIEKFLYKEHIPNFIHAFNDLKRGKNINIECKYKHKNGSLIWAILAGAPIFDEEKKFKGAFGMITDITERKTIEENLKINRQYLNTTLNGLDDLIFLLDTKGNIKEANDAFCISFNLERDKLLNLYAFNLIKEEDIKANRFNIFNDVIRDKKSITFEDSTEGEFWLNSMYPVKDNDGNITSVVVFAKNISERKKIEEDLLLSQRNLSATINGLEDIVILLNKDGIVLEANEAYLKLTNKNREEIIGQNGLTRMPDSIKENRIKYFNSVIQSGQSKTFEDEVLDKYWINSIYPVKNKESEVIRLVAISKDITERKKIEKELFTSEQNLYATFNGIDDIILLIDIEGIILEANNAYCCTVNKKRNEIIGRNAFDILPDEIREQRRIQFEKDKKNAKPNTFEDEARGRIYLNSAYPIKDEKGNVIRMVLISRDISEKKKTEENLIKSQKNFKTSINSIDDIVLLVDSNYNILEANDYYFKIRNQKRENVIGKYSIDLLPVEVKESRLKYLNEAKSKAEILKFEDSIYDRIYLNTIYPVKDHKGEIFQIVIYSKDITDFRKIEESQKINEAKLQSIINSIDELIFLIDIEGKILEINKSYCNLIGEKRENVLYNNIFDYILPDNKESLSKIFKSISDKAEPTFWEFNSRGREWLNSIYPLKDNSGKIEKFVGVSKDITEKNNLEKKVKTSEEKFKYYFENAPYAIDIYDNNGNIFKVNQAFCNLTGYTKEEAESMNVFDFYYEEDIDAAKKSFRNVKEEDVLKEEEIIKGKDGRKIIIELDAFKLSENEFISFFWDITSKKNQEEKLKENEARFRSYIDNAPFIVTIYNNKGELKQVNKNFYKLLGYTKEELQKLHTYDLYYPEDIESGKERINKLNREGRVSDVVRIKGKDNKEIFLQLEAIKLTNDENISFLKDITLEKKAQEEKNYLEYRFNTLVNTINEGIWETDENFITTYVNTHTAEMLGYLPEEIIGIPYDKFTFDEDKQILVEKREERKQGKESIYERRLKHKNGNEIWVLAAGISLFDNNIFKGTFTAIIDITEKKETEQRIKLNEKKFKLYFERSPYAINIFNNNAELIHVNDTFVRLTGYSKEESLKLHTWDLLFPEDIEKGKERVKRLLKEGRVSEDIVLKTKKGEKIFVHLEVVKFTENENIAFWNDLSERIAFEKRIFDSEEKFKLYFEKSPYAIAIFSNNGQILRVNNEFKIISGYNSDDIISMHTYDLLFDEDREEGKVRLEKINKTGYVSQEVIIKTKNGQRKYIQLDAIRLSEEESIAFWKDITEKKKINERLIISEAKFRSYFENSPNPITIFNRYGKIIDSNNASHIISGYEHQEIIHSSMFDLVSEKTIDKAVEDFNRLLKNGEGFSEIIIRKKNGEEMLIQLEVVKLTDSEFIGFWKDITEKKRLEEDVLTREKKFRSYFEHNPNAVVIINKEGNIIDVNKAACSLSGYNYDEIYRHNIFEFLPQESMDIGKDSFDELMSKGNSSVEIMMKLKGDKKLNIRLDSHKLSDEEYFGFITDLSEK